MSGSGSVAGILPSHLHRSPLLPMSLSSPLLPQSSSIPPPPHLPPPTPNRKPPAGPSPLQPASSPLFSPSITSKKLPLAAHSSSKNLPLLPRSPPPKHNTSSTLPTPYLPLIFSNPGHSARKKFFYGVRLCDAPDEIENKFSILLNRFLSYTNFIVLNIDKYK